jgi:hypothetical protein
MDMIKNLICIENSIISVIRLKSDKLEFLKKDGEVEFPITIDFWDWWKKAISYIEGDSVDMCFVYDKDYDILREDFITQNNILNTEESSWNIKWINSYFWQLKPTYVNVSIIGSENQEFVLGGGTASKSGKRFYTNLNFSAESKSQKKATDGNEGVETIDEDDYSPVAKFFIDMIRRERG